MPFPPPPALALINTGYPIFAATFFASFTSVIGSEVPGTSGTSNFATAALAASLLPINSMAFAEGPMKISPALSHASAKSSFSDKNPYPGCMASAPACFAAAIILSIRRYDSALAGGPMQMAVNSNCADAHFSGAAHHSQRNFSAVCNQ